MCYGHILLTSILFLLISRTDFENENLLPVDSCPQNFIPEVTLMTIAHQIVLFEPVLTTCFFFYMVSTLYSISLELYNVQPIAVK